MRFLCRASCLYITLTRDADCLKIDRNHHGFLPHSLPPLVATFQPGGWTASCAAPVFHMTLST
jgi:hypothetical protein